MAKILSMQSYVSYGYVGNKVATFALQRLKHDVIALNTVQFSNHTGYGDWEGEIFSTDHLRSLWAGIKRRIDIAEISGLLTGYLGHEELGLLAEDIHKELRTKNPDVIYCLDPVLGDVGRDIFVRPEVACFFKDKFIANGTIITPNHFEFNYISEHENNTLDDLQNSAKKLFANGIKQILVTSYLGQECSEDEIGMVLLAENEAWLIKTPKLKLLIAPNGAGDLVSALFLEKYLQKLNPKTLLEEIATQVYNIFTVTKNIGRRELQLITGQDYLVTSAVQFQATAI